MSEEWEMPEQVPADASDPRIQAAVAELKQLISGKFPTATYRVVYRDDPEGIHLIAIVDIEDLGEVIDVVASRMVDMQVDEGLPVYVVPEWPEERVRANLERTKGPAWRLSPTLSSATG